MAYMIKYPCERSTLERVHASHASIVQETDCGRRALSITCLRCSTDGCQPHLSQDVLDRAAVERGDAVLQQRAQQHDAADGAQLLRLRAPAEQRPQHRLHSARQVFSTLLPWQCSLMLY